MIVTYHAARKMAKEGRFGTPKPLANIWAEQRELAAIREKKWDRDQRVLY